MFKLALAIIAAFVAACFYAVPQLANQAAALLPHIN
jgi:hypothetical protein